jgi:hypothetical protein
VGRQEGDLDYRWKPLARQRRAHRERSETDGGQLRSTATGELFGLCNGLVLVTGEQALCIRRMPIRVRSIQVVEVGHGSLPILYWQASRALDARFMSKQAAG